MAAIGSNIKIVSRAQLAALRTTVGTHILKVEVVIDSE
jgi:hypothetical protein